MPHTVIGIVPDMPAFVDDGAGVGAAVVDRRGRVPCVPTTTIAASRSSSRASTWRAPRPTWTRFRSGSRLQYPDENKDWGALVGPLQDDMIGDVRSSLLVLLGAVALVLLIACANLANLMLVRTHGRAKEIAVRSALGASRWRVVQQLLAEGLVLGVGGGIAGFAAAYFGVDAARRSRSATALPQTRTKSVVDARVLAFTAAIALATGLLAAFAPAWQLTGRDANDALKTGSGRGNSSSGDGRIRNLLVVSEVALALMLLIGAGLLMRSLSGLRWRGSGIRCEQRPDRDGRYSGGEIHDAGAAQSVLRSRRSQNVRALPGVESAARIDSLPLQGGSTQYVAVEGQPPMKESECRSWRCGCRRRATSRPRGFRCSPAATSPKPTASASRAW